VSVRIAGLRLASSSETLNVKSALIIVKQRK
jgi:hypothetical protein